MQRFLDRKNAITLAVILLAFFVGIQVGAAKIPAIDKVTLANKEPEVSTTADFEPFWEVWNKINEKYPSPDKVTDQERVYGAIAGLVDSLGDPYSVFFAPEEAKSFEEDIRGNFTGIGIEVDMKDKVLTVIAPLKDTPAYRAGLKPGDKILKIDKTSTAGITIDDAVKLIRGEKGTTVTLTVLHEGEKETVEIKVVRDTINIPTLETEMRSDGVFVIKLYSFSANSPVLFKDAMKKFQDAKTDKMVLDLRGNPGGYLEAAVSIASWYLPKGKTVVTEDYGGNKDPEIYRSKGYNIFNDKLKLVILMDGGSASASEILAGALSDYGLAKLVGVQSFGKGSVQEVIKVTPDTVLKLTVAKWLTPKGTSISETGLRPDYEVKLTKENLAAKVDPQLDKAVEVLKNWKK
jgi:carboxyl-terminal processing protease